MLQITVLNWSFRLRVSWLEKVTTKIQPASLFLIVFLINSMLVGSSKQVRCFQCKAFGVLGEDLVKCTHKNCSKYYHRDCIKKWTRTPPKKVLSATGLVCPHHYCDCCVDTVHAKLQKLFVCLQCPIAYHETCSPEGTNLLEDIPGHLICWKHDDEWKHEHQVFY